MALKRPLQVLAYNAKQMLSQGASDAEIDAYLAENGATPEQVMAAPAADEKVLNRILEKEKSGEWAKQQAIAEEAAARAEKGRRNIERLETARGVARGFGEGLTFGAIDEIESAISGRDIDTIRQEQKEFSQAHPMLAIGSTIAGAVANPLNALGVAGKGASLGTKVARGALTSGAQGALYGFGSGEGGIENRLESAAKTGALSAGLGAAIPVAVEGVKAGAKAIGKGLGFTTGTGGAVEQAFKAGQAGDETLLTNMRGQGNIQDVVTDAKRAAQKIRNDAMERYRVAMEGLPEETINMKGIKTAIKDAMAENTLNKGVVDKTADKFLREAKSQISKFTRGTKNQIGIRDVDKIKQAIQAIDVPLEARNAQRVKTGITRALKAEIAESAPQYTKIMKNYSDVAGKLSEIDKTLSLGAGSSADTAVRKLQSLMREGVETNYGNRLSLAEYLEKAGGANIKNAVAGQSLSSWMPRGLVARGLAGAQTVASVANPATGLSLAAAMPRVVGESAYKLGQLSAALSKLPNINVPAYSLVGAGQNF